ncbi:MAG TPA: DNA-3-methyladenine glycosylase I [Myxococcota bacterium]|nr:DNA-3-methyladenine glycosylase I [Myxococcota bacterium]
MPTPTRCPWPTIDLSIRYHDAEWGVPQHDDRTLFEFLILEGAQAGLSWDTILKKRENYRRAFDGFEPEKIARYTAAKTARLLADEGIVRNRAKVAATIANARAYLKLRDQGATLNQLLWSFVDGKPLQPRLTPSDRVPATTPHSSAMSKDLRRRGFAFVGPTICYALMQACGLTNDHLTTCFRHRQVAKLR